jgi:hypothetical protein
MERQIETLLLHVLGPPQHDEDVYDAEISVTMQS